MFLAPFFSETKTAKEGSTKVYECHKFLEITNVLQLLQIVLHPAHSGSGLHLAFTSHLKNSFVNVSGSSSGHRVAHCILQIPVNAVSPKKATHNYARTDTEALTPALGNFTRNYFENFESEDINKNWVLFRKQIKE